MEACGKSDCKNQAFVKAMPACAHCKKHYCISHQLPEVHGCRDAARNQAQLDANAESIKVREAKKSNDRQELLGKLKAKRDELAKERQPKAKKK